MQDEMTDLMDVSNEIQESLGRSYNIPDDVDEEELMGGMEAVYFQLDYANAVILDGFIALLVVGPYLFVDDYRL